MADVSFADLLEKIDVEDSVKKELVELEQKGDRSEKETARYKELLGTLRKELFEEYASDVVEENILRQTELEMAGVEIAMDQDIERAGAIVDAGATLEQKSQDEESLQQARKDVDEA